MTLAKSLWYGRKTLCNTSQLISLQMDLNWIIWYECSSGIYWDGEWNNYNWFEQIIWGNYDVHCRTLRREKKVVGYRRKLLIIEKLEFRLETIKEWNWENWTGDNKLRNPSSFLNKNERESHSVCPTLCEPIDYTVHGILQARILEWVAFPFSRVSSQPRDKTQLFHIAGFYIAYCFHIAVLNKRTKKL